MPPMSIISPRCKEEDNVDACHSTVAALFAPEGPHAVFLRGAAKGTYHGDPRTGATRSRGGRSRADQFRLGPGPANRRTYD